MGIPKVYARKEHHQLVGADAMGFFISLRPGESSLLQAFLGEPETIPVPPQAFEKLFLPITEEIQAS